MTLLLQRVVKGKIMTTQNNVLENDSRRQFIVKGTLLGGGLMLGIGALPDLAYAQIDQKDKFVKTFLVTYHGYMIHHMKTTSSFLRHINIVYAQKEMVWTHIVFGNVCIWMLYQFV
jgi:hypothetical protein